MVNHNPTFESFQRELEQVLDRHRELLGANTGYTLSVAMHALEAERARYGVEVDDIRNAGPEDVWFMEFDDGGAAMLGLVGHPEKRDQIDVDVNELDMGQSDAWRHKRGRTDGGRR